MSTHALKYNGAAHDGIGNLLNSDPKVTAGSGRAACSCGWTSEELPSGGARRAAHKEHKAQEESTATEPVFSDAEETHSDVSEDPAVDLVDMDPIGDPVGKLLVSYTLAFVGTEEQKAPAKVYWRCFGVEGAAVVADALGLPEIGYDSKEMEVQILTDGSQEQEDSAKELVDLLPRMWGAGNFAMRDFKKTATYKALDKHSKWGADEAFKLEKDFLGNFAAGVADFLADTPTTKGSEGYRAGLAWATEQDADSADLI